jgi:glycosyltransferase involved in cell wall biosynthesis
VPPSVIGETTEPPKLAFVIPAYNEEALIGQCLQSICDELDRSGVPAEVVVVDNASTDRTGEVAGRFKRVRVITENRKGIVYARKAGYDATTAPLVANIDADNQLTPGWSNTVVGEFEADPELVALSGPFIYHDLGPLHQAWVKMFYWGAYFAYLVNRFVLKVGSMLQGGNFIIKRSAWDQAGGYDTKIDFYGEDIDVAVRLFRFGKVKWMWRLPILSSGRRLAKEGIVKSGWVYALNFIWVTFTGRPKTEEYTDIRPGSD